MAGWLMCCIAEARRVMGSGCPPALTPNQRPFFLSFVVRALTSPGSFFPPLNSLRSGPLIILSLFLVSRLGRQLLYGPHQGFLLTPSRLARLAARPLVTSTFLLTPSLVPTLVHTSTATRHGSLHSAAGDCTLQEGQSWNFPRGDLGPAPDRRREEDGHEEWNLLWRGRGS